MKSKETVSNIERLKEITIQINKLTLESQQLIESLRPEDVKFVSDIASSTDTTDILQTGDIIVLLTAGVRIRKGDKARVTEIKGSTVHFKVLKNQVQSYRMIKNVRKVTSDKGLQG